MDISEASSLLEANRANNRGQIYHQPSSLRPLGVGKILSNVKYASYKEDQGAFVTKKGTVIILTHECDLENNRPFNYLSLICPIIPLDAFLPILKGNLTDDDLKTFFIQVAKNKVSRLVYLPPINENSLSHGGFIYLNQFSHAHINDLKLEDVFEVSHLTDYSLRTLDYRLTNHLLRPKAISIQPL